MRRKALVASLGLALFLAACSEYADGRQARPDAQASSDGRANSVPQAGFGGVVEVTFSTKEAVVQDALARECGLFDGRLAPLTVTPPSLPPRARWYPQPPDVEAAIACMERQQDVRRVLLPL